MIYVSLLILGGTEVATDMRGDMVLEFFVSNNFFYFPFRPPSSTSRNPSSRVRITPEEVWEGSFRDFRSVILVNRATRDREVEIWRTVLPDGVGYSFYCNFHLFIDE